MTLKLQKLEEAQKQWLTHEQSHGGHGWMVSKPKDSCDAVLIMVTSLSLYVVECVA